MMCGEVSLKNAFIQPLQQLIRHHIESFNFMLDEGLQYAIQVSCVGSSVCITELCAVPRI